MRTETWYGHKIRFIEINGEWYAILKDICDALKLRAKDVSQRIDPDMLERVNVPSNANIPSKYNSIENNPERLNIEIPVCVFDGICEKYVLREYQEDALKNFIYYMKNKDFYQNKIMNNDLFFLNKNHLLFNVATGGGKTLLMACVILYLHNEYGYNNFLFLSHLNSINTKTKEIAAYNLRTNSELMKDLEGKTEIRN